jgi:hypothetical protein
VRVDDSFRANRGAITPGMAPSASRLVHRNPQRRGDNEVAAEPELFRARCIALRCPALLLAADVTDDRGGQAFEALELPLVDA